MRDADVVICESTRELIDEILQPAAQLAGLRARGEPEAVLRLAEAFLAEQAAQIEQVLDDLAEQAQATRH